MKLPIKYEEGRKGQEKYQHLKSGQAKRGQQVMLRMNNEKERGEAREECHKSQGKQKASRGDNIKCCTEAR